MRVEVLFRSHRYEEFDTSPQTCSEPYRGKGTAILMDWNLHIDLDPEGMGIVLVQHWYDGSAGSGQGTVRLGGVEVPVGARKLGCAMLLVAPDELSEVVWLKKDGEKILWREGDDLINGERFFAMEQLCYSDAVTKSVNKRARGGLRLPLQRPSRLGRRGDGPRHGLHRVRHRAHPGDGILAAGDVGGVRH